jgi:hypothetical protein
MATSPDATVRTGVLLTIDGTVYDTSDPTASLPEGVTSRPLLGTTETFGRIVTVPTGAFRDVRVRLDVEPAQGSDAASAQVTLSIDGRNQPRVTLQGGVPTGGAESGFDIENGLLRVVAPDADGAEVQVDNGRSSFGFPVPDGSEVEIGASDGLVEILLVDEEGEVIGTYDLDEGSPEDGVVYLDGEFDETTGLFEVTETEGESEDVDAARTEFFAGALGLDDLDAAEGDSGQDGSGDDGTGDGGGADDADGGLADDPGADDWGSGDSGAGDPAADDPADDPAVDDPADEPPADEPPAEDPADEDPGAAE